MSDKHYIIALYAWDPISWISFQRYLQTNHILYNSITCSPRALKLIEAFKDKGYGATGTIRINRVEQCTLRSWSSQKWSQRRLWVQDWCQYCCGSLEWHRRSNRSFKLPSSGVYSTGNVKRWSASFKRFVDIEQPHLIKFYKQNIWGTDKMDQNVSNHDSNHILVRICMYWRQFDPFYLCPPCSEIL